MVRPLDGWDHRRRAAVQRVAPAPGGLPETGSGDHTGAGGSRLRAHPQPGPGAPAGRPGRNPSHRAGPPRRRHETGHDADGGRSPGERVRPAHPGSRGRQGQGGPPDRPRGPPAGPGQAGGADGGEPDPPGAGAPPVRGAALGPGGPHGEGRMTKNRRGNDPGMRPEVRVVGDVTSAALDLFLDESPATFLLTGGSTPVALYERMAELQGYPWEETEFFISDERCVPDTDPLSNFGIID